MSKSAQAHKDQTVERFKKLHDIEDGTSYRAVAKENSRKDNKLGIKNIYQDKNNGLYILQMQMGTFKIRKSFSSLDEAIEERDRIRKEVILPAVEAHKTLSD